MAYTTSSEVESDFKNTSFKPAADAEPTNVTSEDVDQFIKEADALINSYIGQKYVTPVTTGDCLELLKLYSRSLVSDRIRGILEVKQAVTTDADQKPKRTMSYEDVIKELGKIRDGKTALIGATLLNPNGSFFSSNYANDVEPEMRKGERQW